MDNHHEIVLYPYCLQDGLLVRPEDVQGDHGNLTCLACSSPMITVKDGDRNHFEHPSGLGQECTVEIALHEASKMAIQDGFNAARTVGRKYLLICVCQGCLKYLNYDLTQYADKVVLDFSSDVMTMGSDVMFISKSDTPVLAVALVFGRDLEPETLKEYHRLGIPVFEVQPTWAAIEQFRSMHISGSHHKSEVVSVKIAQLTCLSCRQINQK